MKKFAPLILIFIALNARAQNNITWSSPITIGGPAAYDCPRICVSNSIPFISYGDFISGDFFATRIVSGAATLPYQINDPGTPAVINSIVGPDIESSGDTIFITYIGLNSTHVYLQQSVDGGLNFGGSVKVDNIGSDIPQYASLAIMPGGNPIIAFAKLDSNFTNPQYVVTKSYDAGISFSPVIDATAALGADPCDCCQGNIAINDNKVAVIYRNSFNNLRDMRAVFSTDTANTFTSIGAIDNNGWVIAVCPSSGGQGIINGDTLTSVFMNGISGSNTCFISTTNMVTNQSGLVKKIFNTPGIGSQNVARMAGSGDTLGVVWDQDINGLRNILFSYSTTGAAGIGIVVDTISDVIANGSHVIPDIAYANGKFHVVFSDYGATQQVYYMEGTVNATSGLSEHPVNDEIKISVDNNTSIKIQSNKTINSNTIVSVIDNLGKQIEKIKLPNLQLTQVVKLNHQLTGGVYFVTVSSKNFKTTRKIVITNR